LLHFVQMRSMDSSPPHTLALMRRELLSISCDLAVPELTNVDRALDACEDTLKWAKYTVFDCRSKAKCRQSTKHFVVVFKLNCYILKFA